MSARDLAIAAAEADVETRRSQLFQTLDEIRELLAPRKLVQDAWESAKVKGADIAEDAVEAVKRRPVAVSGAVAALTMFLAREPIKNGLVSIYDAMTSKKPTRAKPAQPAKPRLRSTPRKKKTTETNT